MLVLTRKVGEAIVINNGEITIKIQSTRGQTVRIAVDAPKDCPVDREEIHELKQQARANAQVAQPR